jgi:hypothetical protein
LLHLQMNDDRHYINYARFYLRASKKWYNDAKKTAVPSEKVEALDRCLDTYEKYAKYMGILGRPLPPKREAFWNKAKAKRERYAQVQKNKEDNESLQRINALFAQI